MRKFRLKTYTIASKKIKRYPVRMHFLSDLHGVCYGLQNQKLVRTILKRKPDLVVIGGDMVIGGNLDSIVPVQHLVRELSERVPVFYAYGNHEQEMFRRKWEREREEELVEAFSYFLQSHTTVLDNCGQFCKVKGESLFLEGLSLNRKYYRKPFPRRLSFEEIQKKLGTGAPKDCFEMLLAHNPYHANAYWKRGSDLILSGHYHGGVVRFGEHTGLVSTHMHPFPRYCCGIFQKKNQHLIVSSGLGEHTVRVRVHNPRELIEINLVPEGSTKSRSLQTERFWIK